MIVIRQDGDRAIKAGLSTVIRVACKGLITGCCLAALFGAPAWADQSAAASPAAASDTAPAAPSSTGVAAEAAENAQLQEVIVTGSRIPAPNEVSTSPIQVLSSAYIAKTGLTDTGDIINQLPQNFTNSLGQDLGNGTSGLSTAGGVSTADLRGLGPNRTLVLVDGRRLGQGSPYTFIQSPAPDLDQIPAGLVERVEVVTGGASAAYGSDAIAGVVNFIMKHDFQGFQFDGNFDEYLHDNGNTAAQAQVRAFGTTPATGLTQDGRQGNFDMLMGTNFADGNGNVTAFLSYRHQEPVVSSERDFGGCEFNTPLTDANGTITGADCGGSSNSNAYEPLTGPNANTTYSVKGNNFVKQGLGIATTPPASFNSQPYIYMTREDDRYNAAFLAHDTITDWFQPYAEVYFMDDRTHQQIAPAALFKDLNPTDPTGSGEYQVNCNNPFLSGQEASILCSPSQLTYAAANPDAACINVAGTTSLNCADVRIGRRNIEGGGRLSDYEHENYRPVFGFKGDLGDAWTYDVYGQYFYTTFFNINEKYLNFQGIDNALQVTGTAANPTCVSGAPCVPYNIFADGGVTPAALNYLYLNGTGEGTSTLRTIHAEITGQLGKYGIHSPLATDGVGVDLGFEHRNDNEYFLPDYAEESGLLSGFGSAAVPINNSVSVSEEFLELRAPLVQNVTGVKELLFDGGYRRSDYTTSGPVNTYKFEVQYAPIEDYRLRLSYDKAIRAPSVVELYNPQLVGGAQLGNDPCAPTFTGTGAIAAPAQDTLAECEHMGVKASQYGNGSTTDTIPQGAAGQLSQLAGGNPNLQPEQAETYTIGINFAPSQVPNFKGSVDYYHIALSQEVTVIPAGVILANCAATGSPLYCSQIVRSNVTGGLTGSTIAGGGYIIQSNVNAGAAVDSGIDVQFNYKIDLPKSLGAVDFDMNGSYLQHAETTPLPGQHTYDCAGLFGFVCQTIDPRWHHIFSASWQTPWNVTATATWRYIGKVEEDNNDSDPSLHFAVWGAYDKFNAVIPSYSYLDLTANWRVNSILSFRAGFNNIMDKDPPIIDGNIVGGGAANTYPIYDMFGRQLFLGFTAKF